MPKSVPVSVWLWIGGWLLVLRSTHMDPPLWMFISPSLSLFPHLSRSLSYFHSTISRKKNKNLNDYNDSMIVMNVMFDLKSWSILPTLLAPLVTLKTCLDPKVTSFCIAFSPPSTDCIQNPPKWSSSACQSCARPFLEAFPIFKVSSPLFLPQVLLFDDVFLF